jgi:hypothetical protein
MALEDAQRTVGLVWFHATEWHINLHKIGVLGFSAGGHVVAGMSTHFEQRLKASLEKVDSGKRTGPANILGLFRIFERDHSSELGAVARKYQRPCRRLAPDGVHSFLS